MSYRTAMSALAVAAFLLGSALNLPAQETAPKKTGELRYSGVVIPMHSVTMQPIMVVNTSVRISKVLFEEGDMVKKGQLLVQLDNREPAVQLKMAEQKVEQDKVALVYYQRQLDYQIMELKRDVDANEGAKKKGQSLVFAQMDVDKLQVQVDLAKIQLDTQKATIVADELQVEEYKTRLEYYELHAPFDGVITQKTAEEGQTVDNTTKVFQVMEVSSVLVMIFVETCYYATIAEGDKVTVTIEELPGRTFDGTVYSRSPAADPTSKTFILKVKLDNKDNAIKPGWYANVVLPAKVAAAKPAK